MNLYSVCFPPYNHAGMDSREIGLGPPQTRVKKQETRNKTV